MIHWRRKQSCIPVVLSELQRKLVQPGYCSRLQVPSCLKNKITHYTMFPFSALVHFPAITASFRIYWCFPTQLWTVTAFAWTAQSKIADRDEFFQKAFSTSHTEQWNSFQHLRNIFICFVYREISMCIHLKAEIINLIIFLRK